MQLVDKIHAQFLPDTAHRAYLNATPVELDIDVMRFSDGTLRVRVLNLESINFSGSLHTSAYVQTLDDLMIAAQIRDIVERYATNKPLVIATTVLSITSPIYSRYDRVMFSDKSDAFGAKVCSAFIEACDYKITRVFDNHSKVLTDYTRNMFDFSQRTLLQEVKKGYPFLSNYVTIAPDAGAADKNPSATLTFSKDRNPTTGFISGVRWNGRGDMDKPAYLVVDDLCEGGRTFIEVANEFKKHCTNKNATLSLYVTHGLFTNEAIPKLLEHYQHIFVYIMQKSVYDTLTQKEKDRLFVTTLVDC